MTYIVRWFHCSWKEGFKVFNNTKSRLLLGISVVLGIASSALLVLTPIIIGQAVDAMLGYQNVQFDTVNRMLVLALSAYIAYFLSSWIMAQFTNYVVIQEVERTRNALSEHLFKLPFSSLDTMQQGDVLQHFSLDSELVMDGMFQFITQAITGLTTVVLAIIYMSSINMWMSLLVLGLTPFIFLISRIIAKKSSKYFKQQQHISGRLSGFVNERFENYDLILTQNLQDQAELEFQEINQELNEVGEKAQFLSALVNPTTRVVNNMTYLLLGLVGALSVMHYGMSIGVFTSFVSVSIIFSKPLNEFSAISSQVMAGLAGYRRIQTLMAKTEESDVLTQHSFMAQTIDFKDVNFAYQPGRNVLEDVQLHIEPLSKVAIVGPTGAGKSTLINLLMRFYDPQTGGIYIDDINTQTVERASVRAAMSIVLQDPWLFEGSIRDNLKYGFAQASDEQMIAAAKQADIHDFIMNLNEGYDTILSNQSQNISVGQRQLLTIARALVVDAPILILDEATSNIDVVTEKKIQDVFTKVMKTRTSFFIAHRLATVVDSDIILVMNEGRLIEQGDHQSLMSEKGFYYHLFMSQF